MPQILIVDDSSGIRHQVTTFLKENGYDVIAADDGRTGVEQAKKNPSLKLIIADVNMPDMDGLTMVEKIREAGNQNVAVLMLTTESQPMLKQRAKASGVKGWLVKPFNGPGTLPIIKQLVGS
ncbi:MAG: response regulator [SAR324 cluster bacterium]|nr:response regulator [SAR324 cluster bacterium]